MVLVTQHKRYGTNELFDIVKKSTVSRKREGEEKEGKK